MDFALVKEALFERATVLANAPHVAQVLPFVIPCHSRLDHAFYRSGLALYDWLAGNRNVGRSHSLRALDLQTQAPSIAPCPFGVQYFDGLFDDARLAQSIARTARHEGAILMNYCHAQLLDQDSLSGSNKVLLTRQDTHETVTLQARCTIFATGAWSGERVAVSRGSHIVIPDIGLNSGVLIPKTPDGRVLYILPWLGHTLIGTTDITVPTPDYSTSAPAEDVNWLIRTASLALREPLKKEDVCASFVGYRPLVRPKKTPYHSAQFSRTHVVERAGPNSLRIIGGKWTTYRRMAQDTLDTAITWNVLPQGRACATVSHPLIPNPVLDNAWLTQSSWSDSELCDIVSSAVKDEASVTAEDVLYRRLRTGFTNQALAQTLTPKVAQYLDRL
jgi:glycerol-3-phosphate dehydrogenase